MESIDACGKNEVDEEVDGVNDEGIFDLVVVWQYAELF